MRRVWPWFLPVSMIVILFVVLYNGLYVNPTHIMPSQLLNHTIPRFSARNILNEKQLFTSKTFEAHPIALLNIWATWCYACRIEHATLMRIKHDYHVPIYAIAYKDDRDTILQWLLKRGNPYTMVALDQTGDLVIDFGIYGTPETFLIDGSGTVLYRHVGALSDSVFLNEMLPIIKRYQKT